MLDRLPAWARHALIIAGSTFLAVVGKAILDAGGVTGLDVNATAAAALNQAAVAVVLGSGLLALTPLSRQYGIGSP